MVNPNFIILPLIIKLYYLFKIKFFFFAGSDIFHEF